ncbi:MAG: ABC transporter ATP-binding protein [Ignavibacteriales bacterium]|nr:ABC transporter ATP-binding protein [Ignavibacteriales bacterium]
MENVIEIESLRKTYKDFILRNVSFAIPKGYITGLIGPNGAGKTTIIKLIMNLIRRDEGTIRVFGLDNKKHEVEVKDRIGFVYDTPYFYEDQDLLTLMRSIGPFYSRWNEKQFLGLLDRFGLSRKKRFSALSKGMKTKFSLALALSHDADLIIMDEPTTGLDPLFRREFLEMLSEIMQSEEKSVLFSTHITSDLDRIADHVILIEDGELRCSLWKDEIQEKWGIVKAREDFITSDNKHFFRGWRKHQHGFEALTSDVPVVRQQLSSEVLIDKPTLEDLIFFMHKGGDNAQTPRK